MNFLPSLFSCPILPGMERTSITDPLQIGAAAAPGGGRIGMTICPGKKQPDAVSGSWNRDLDIDLDAIRAWGAEALVSLIEPKEYQSLGVEALPERAKARMAHFSLPIPDYGLPGPEWETQWEQAGPLLRSILRRGGSVCVHCKGGLGRSGTIAARLLVELGVSPVEAVRRVRAARKGAIETREQERYVYSFKRLADRAERFRGCLLGGAVGDALGAPVEFTDRPAILARFGPGGIRDYVPAYGKIGAITDDTQMTLFTAEGMIRAHVRGCLRGLSTYEGVTQHAYLRWLATQGYSLDETKFGMDGWLIGHRELFSRRAPGNTCISSLASCAKDTRQLNARNDSKGCGAVMRMAPVGLYAAAVHFSELKSDSRVFEIGNSLAAITHGHPSGQYPAGALAVIIRRLVEGEDLPTALDAAEHVVTKVPRHEETLAAIRQARRLAAGTESADSCIRRLGEGWTAEEALAIAVFCSLRASSFEEGVCMAVNITGDSDSTGAVTGNILGAMLGAGSIPDRWREPLELREVIEAMAEDLFGIGDWLLSDSSFPRPEDDYSSIREEAERYIHRRYPGW